MNASDDELERMICEADDLEPFMALCERCVAMDKRYKAGSEVMATAWARLIVVIERVCGEGER